MRDDLISRQAAIDLIRENCYLVRLFSNSIEEGMTLTGIEQALNVLPTVQPKTGRWFGTVCSACGESYPYNYDAKYCPNCGARMEEVIE